MQKVYIVGRVNPRNALEWKLLGVYTKEPDAIDACRTINDFVDLVVPNRLHKGKPDWPDAFYPLS